MKIGLSSLYLTTESFKKLVEDLNSYGESCKVWEIVDEAVLRLNRRKVEVLKELQKSFSFEYSLHTPFCDINIASINPQIRRLTLKILEKSILNAAKLEAKMCVLHPGFYDVFHLKKTTKLNLQSIERLVNYAENLGVPVSIENLPANLPTLTKVEDFETLFKQLNQIDLKLALDVGHAHTVGQLKTFLENFKDRINHVHLHDNDGSFDSHLELGKGSIDWVNVLKTLRKNGFKGYVIIESTSNPIGSFIKAKETFLSL